MFDELEEVLPRIHQNSFIVPVEEPYEFTDFKEQQAYGGFHYELDFKEDGSCIMQKHASRVLTNYR